MRALQYLLLGWAFSAAVAVIRFIGPRGRGFLTRGSASLLFLSVPSRRRVVMRNLARAFGKAPDARAREEMVRDAYRMSILTIVDGFNSMGKGGGEALAAAVRVEGLERLQSALSRGKGAVCVSAHYGPFPFIGSALGARGIPFNFLYRRPRSPVVDAKFGAWIRTNRFGVIMDAPRLAAVRDCLRALHAGSCVCILVDQHYAQGVEVPFFGHPARTGVGAAVLSARSGAPLVPMHISHHRARPGAYILSIDEPISPPADTSEDSLRACMAKLTARVEGWIREDPGQWYWMHRRWKDLDNAGK